jgi:hypothetical protein
MLVAALSGCGILRPGWVREDSYDIDDSKITTKDFDGPLGGHFDSDGNWVPNKTEIVTSYKLPDISAGFLLDVKQWVVTPTIQIELLEVDTHIPYVRTLKFDFGVGYQRAYGYVGKLLTNIFEISIGAVFGWNFEDREFFYGPAFTIIKF